MDIKVFGNSITLAFPGKSAAELKMASTYTATSGGIEVAFDGIHLITMPYPAQQVDAPEPAKNANPASRTLPAPAR